MDARVARLGLLCDAWVPCASLRGALSATRTHRARWIAGHVSGVPPRHFRRLSSTVPVASGIPVVDMSSWFHVPPGSGSGVPQKAVSDEQTACASALLRACERVGFVYLSGLPACPDATSACFQAARDFFSLPPRLKNACRTHTGRKGYYEYIGEAGAVQGTDHIEAFHIEHEGTAEDRLARRRRYFEAREWPEDMWVPETVQGNRWPVDAPASLRSGAGVDEAALRRQATAMASYFDDCTRSCTAVLEALAVGLGLPLTTLTDLHAAADHQLEAKLYPRTAARGVPRIADHRDQSSITLLAQDSVGGLEIWHAERQAWLQAPAIPGTLLMNTGDFLAAWTRGRLLSTRHRVVPPGFDCVTAGHVHNQRPAAVHTVPGDDSGGGEAGDGADWRQREPSSDMVTERATAPSPAPVADRARYSLVFFCTPDWTAVADPLPFELGSVSTPATLAPGRESGGSDGDETWVGDLMPAV